MGTFTAKERTYRNPDGEIVGEGHQVGGATLVCAPGDEMTREDAIAQGLIKPTKAEKAADTGEVDVLTARVAALEAREAELTRVNAGLQSQVDDKVATAAADALRAKAEQAQADQAPDDQLSAVDRDANAADAKAAADASAKKAEADPTPKGTPAAKDKRRGPAKDK